MGRESRRRNRTRTSVRTAGASAATTSTAPAMDGAAAPIQVRADRVIERESRMMIIESKRVAWVSAVCFGMLAILVIVDRLQ